MPKFGEQSLNRLSTCHQDLQLVMHEAIKEIDFTILHGYRSPEEQFEIYKQGRRLVNGKWTKVGTTFTELDGKIKKSKHNYSPSLAVDIAPYPIDWNDYERFRQLAKVVMRCSEDLGIKLKWGGNFTWKDLPHFQLENV